LNASNTSASTAGLAAAANAQIILAGSATADNLFAASVSTSATAPGTVWLSGNNWPSTFSGSTEITEAGTYYLHVFAQDQGRPEMFIGRFTLTGQSAFANGTQELLTNATDWVVSTSNPGVDTTAPIIIGPNGSGPWGTYSSMPGASFIWAPQYANGIAYFTASFTVIPAPATAAASADPSPTSFPFPRRWCLTAACSFFHTTPQQSSTYNFIQTKSTQTLASTRTIRYLVRTYTEQGDPHGHPPRLHSSPDPSRPLPHHLPRR
jgi:hypothetical protein